ncbi:hypothetical protein CER18_08255 [Bartonella tribocorum]|uniref:Uncharacterized protein n=1 Tax=Bartonella tribocorum TaxID=85701 RepID=A0A2N9Y8V4_9HYPH|nr:hypothetical protein CER18_08255 [Bartonella tribocorum]
MARFIHSRDIRRGGGRNIRQRGGRSLRGEPIVVGDEEDALIIWKVRAFLENWGIDQKTRKSHAALFVVLKRAGVRKEMCLYKKGKSNEGEKFSIL